MNKHTQGPWKINKQKPEIVETAGQKSLQLIAYCKEFFSPPSIEEKANAEFIVNACNSHYDLLEALKNLMKVAAKDAESYAPEGNEPIWAFINDASDVIAKAEGAL